MNKVYVRGYSVLNALGNDISDFTDALKEGRSAVRRVKDAAFGPEPFWAAPVPASVRAGIAARYSAVTPHWTEQMLLYTADALKSGLPVPLHHKDVVVLLSSTKGNIDTLGQEGERAALYRLGETLQAYYDLDYIPKVYSTACISGLVAIITASRWLQAGRYKYAVVIGADAFTPFVYKGFQSFQAIGNGPCRPFDRDRKGINLGECAAGIVLSSVPGPDAGSRVVIAGGGLSNDANHLSGPSRTGQELADAIGAALQEASLPPGEVAAVSAHGTATVYNDEMEAKAMHLAGVQAAPVYSLKSYIGHTLGAAGIVETITGIRLLEAGLLLPSLHYEACGTSLPLQVSTEYRAYPHTNFLKTASGFGGCNAALVVRKAPF